MACGRTDDHRSGRSIASLPLKGCSVKHGKKVLYSEPADDLACENEPVGMR